ncbi:MAG: acyl-CoA dehydrogenase family protein [Chloroflexi bacterium]|nr:acyl-CoA dehydrogenase family protein [Chloroflexota bacterium]
MDFRFRPEDESFRQEVRTFLKKELPPGWRGTRGEIQPEDFEIDRTMRQKLAKKGWLALAWPKEYGGAGADVLRQTVMSEEMAYHRAPGRDGQGIGLIGPCIMVHGRDDQKKDHLGRIARGEVIWCQGFSEPGSGSDLASLQTKAVRDGDDWVINGSKIWTTYGHLADWMHILTRTDPEVPKHKGISYFLLDMKTPGIEIRPLINISNSHGFNQVFFTNVRVPARNMLGETNRGWYVATTTLDFERSMAGQSASVRRTLEEVIEYLRGIKGPDGRSPLQEPRIRHKLAELVIAGGVARGLAYRVAWMQHNKQIPNMEASLGKLYASELTQKVARTLMDVLGMYAQIEWSDKRAPIDGRIEFSYLNTISMTIAAGTSEIQRNIIATRGLGLPR